MGIRLVESIKLSCSGANPRWEMGAINANVLFDGEFFAVCCRPSDCQPGGPLFDLEWSDIYTEGYIDEALTGFFSVPPLELLEPLSELACDGYIAEPAA